MELVCLGVKDRLSSGAVVVPVPGVLAGICISELSPSRIVVRAGNVLETYLSFIVELTSDGKESEMAKGKKCPCCGMAMFAQREDDQDRGRWVTYVCQNSACEKCGRGSKARCNHTGKVFEGYAC